MTPVISDSRFVKGELLFHILEHGGFVSASAQRKYTEGSASQPKRPSPAFQRKRWSGSWFMGMYVPVGSSIRESARDIAVKCEITPMPWDFRI